MPASFKSQGAHNMPATSSSSTTTHNIYKPKHSSRAHRAARIAASKQQKQLKAAYSRSSSPVQSVMRVDQSGNRSMVLRFDTTVVRATLAKVASRRAVHTELRTAEDGRLTHVLRFDRAFFHNAIVNGAAGRLRDIDLSAGSPRTDAYWRRQPMCVG